MIKHRARALTYAVTLSLMLSGNLVLAASSEGYFCQVSPDNEGWSCVRDAALAKRPKPTRLPQSARAPEPTFDTPVDPPAQVAPPVRHQDSPAPDQPAVAAPTVARPADATPARTAPSAGLPPHIALAYQPERPTPLTDLPASFWAIQLVALSSREAVETFARDFPADGLAAARIAANDRLFYILLLGIYETRRDAEVALESLSVSEDIYPGTPWIRSMGSLQAAMRAAELLDDNG